MKLTATVVTIGICLCLYLVTTVPAFLFYHAKPPVPTNQHVLIISIPLLFYFLLTLINDRQGLNIFLGTFLIGIAPSIFMLMCRWWIWPEQHMIAGMIICLMITLLIWIFLPKTFVNGFF